MRGYVDIHGDMLVIPTCKKGIETKVVHIAEQPFYFWR